MHKILFRNILSSNESWDSQRGGKILYIWSCIHISKQLRCHSKHWHILSVNRQVTESHVFSKCKMFFSGVQLGIVTTVRAATFPSLNSSYIFFPKVFHNLLSHFTQPKSLGELLFFSIYTSNHEWTSFSVQNVVAMVWNNIFKMA